jgi:hypothetical protein
MNFGDTASVLAVASRPMNVPNCVLPLESKNRNVSALNPSCIQKKEGWRFVAVGE